MESVYLETTVVSYLVARPSRDLLVAAHQQTTQEWWTERRAEFKCYVSQVVIDEASLGDSQEVQKRLAVIGDLPALKVTEHAEASAQAILSSGALPPSAVRDAAHVAVGCGNSSPHNLTLMSRPSSPTCGSAKGRLARGSSARQRLQSRDLASWPCSESLVPPRRPG
jgi:hypothetical protein